MAAKSSIQRRSSLGKLMDLCHNGVVGMRIDSVHRDTILAARQIIHTIRCFCLESYIYLVLAMLTTQLLCCVYLLRDTHHFLLLCILGLSIIAAKSFSASSHLPVQRRQHQSRKKQL